MNSDYQIIPSEDPVEQARLDGYLRAPLEVRDAATRAELELELRRAHPELSTREMRRLLARGGRKAPQR